MKKWMIGLPIAALAMTGGAYAQQTTKPADNAVMTKADAQARAVAMFAKMDVNKDGKLDQADRAARFEERRGKMFDRMDTNKDGNITRAEFTTMKPRADRGAEGGKMAGKMERGGKDGHRGHRGGKHGMGRGMMGGHMADTNGDKAVTQAEFTAAAAKRFDALDANKDGQVTREERKAAREQMRAEWQEKRAANAAATAK